MLTAMLIGGPKDKTTVPHPGIWIFRVPVPKPIEAISPQDAMQGLADYCRAEPNYEVADYQFNGQAVVDLTGKIKYMIYNYIGMES
jgi:hypothetical protein